MLGSIPSARGTLSLLSTRVTSMIVRNAVPRVHPPKSKGEKEGAGRGKIAGSGPLKKFHSDGRAYGIDAERVVSISNLPIFLLLNHLRRERDRFIFSSPFPSSLTP